MSLLWPNTEKLTGKFGRLQNDAAPIMEGALYETAKPGLIKAQQLVPVDTGYLKSRLQLVRVSAGLRGRGIKVVEIHLIDDAPYSGFVEFGTRKMTAQPYLRPAARYMEGKIGGITAANVSMRLRDFSR